MNMKTFNKPSDMISDKFQILKCETIEEIRKAINNEFFDLEENGFEDDNNNDIEAVSSYQVYFNGGNTYKISELSLEDAIYLLQTIETMKERRSATLNQ